MNITDYFYKKIKGKNNFCSNFPNSICCHTVNELWDKFISLTLAKKKSVIAWHDLLVSYIFDSNDPILFCRLYESGGYKDVNGIQIDEIRRTAITKDGNTRYMFVSNYDAAEMFNIVLKEVSADINEFTSLINNKKYKFHFQQKSPIPNKKNFLAYKNNHILPLGFNGNSIQEEAYILSGYPKTGTVKGSVLNQSNRYLAHIIGVKDIPFLLPSGKLVYGTYLQKLLPRGDIRDWSDMPNSIRIKNSRFSNDDLAIIKAHFLRLFDPLNYFATPSKNNHITTGTLSLNKNIGEYWEVQKFVEKQYENIYGKKRLDEFRKLALVPDNEDCKYKKIKETTYENIKFQNVIIKIGINKSKKTVCAGYKKSKTSSSNSNIKIVFNPSNEKDFKKLFLINKKARIIWKYSDGTQKVSVWIVRHMNDKSSIKGNIQSRLEWRKKNKTGLAGVELELI